MSDIYLLNVSTSQLKPLLTHDFNVIYTNINLNPNKNYVLGLKSYSMWYSWFNVSAENNNNNFRFSIDNGATFIDAVLADGNYSLDDIQTSINNIVVNNSGVSNSIKFLPNYNTLRVELSLATNYQVDFTPSNSLRLLLGFNSQVYSAPFTSSPNIPNITNSVDALNINCSLLNSNNNLINNTPSQTLYQFVPQTSVGTNLSEQISQITFLPISNSGNINNMRFFITDQNLNILNLNGEHVSLSLVLKEAD